MLRDLLRSVPNLCCPEETHFYRWADPYGTVPYIQIYTGNALLAHHRSLDGISDEINQALLSVCATRAEYMTRYMEHFAEAHGMPLSTRWFDKTPQNIFGVTLLANDFPKAKFVHLHRDPRNVVASLKVGKVMKIDSPVGASNYWRESEVLAASFEAANPDRMLSVRYGDLTDDPHKHLDAICDFVEIERVGSEVAAQVRPERNVYGDVLTVDELDVVGRVCGPMAAHLEYDLRLDPPS